MIFGIFVLLASVVTKRTGLPQKIDFTSLFVCVYRVFGENAVCYNSDSLYVGNCAPVRKWWNWQTHHLSLGVARTPNEVASAASASAGRGGLPSALRLYVEGLAERSGLRVELDIDPNLQRPCLMPREDSVRHSLGVANQYPLPCESQDRSIARRDQDGLCTASRIERV